MASSSAVRETFRGALPGLWSGGGGMLRPSVAVEPGHDAWRIGHSIWEISLPAALVVSEPDLREFLERRRPAGEVRSENEAVVRLMQLLLAQGCATYDGSRHSYTLSEVGHLVSALCNRWYGAYYRHAFWANLGQCRLSRPQLFAWALRTYHLSRSAGPTAARGAIRSANPQARLAFIKSATEEYSHCEIYYMPEHSAFGLDRAWIAELVPMASSTAFDQQMAVAAEEDWLAHACAAFFQEYTASFREQAFALYDRLERAYGLPGFFNGWKKHIGYDVDHTHADDFGKLFSGDAEVNRDRLNHSVANAAAVVEYLIGALDELAEIPATLDIRSFRVSPSQCARLGVSTDVLGGRLGDARRFLAIGDTRRLSRALVEAVRVSDNRHASKIAVDLQADVFADLAARALSVADSHADIVLLGRWLDTYLGRGGRPERGWLALEFRSAGQRAMYNFIRESANDSAAVLTLFELTEALAAGPSPRTGAPMGRDIRDHERPRVLTSAARWLELLTSASTKWSTLGAEDLLVQ